MQNYNNVLNSKILYGGADAPAVAAAAAAAHTGNLWNHIMDLVRHYDPQNEEEEEVQFKIIERLQDDLQEQLLKVDRLQNGLEMLKSIYRDSHQELRLANITLKQCREDTDNCEEMIKFILFSNPIRESILMEIYSSGENQPDIQAKIHLMLITLDDILSRIHRDELSVNDMEKSALYLLRVKLNQALI